MPSDFGLIQYLGHNLYVRLHRKNGGPVEIEVEGKFTNESWHVVQAAVTRSIARIVKDSDNAERDASQTWD